MKSTTGAVGPACLILLLLMAGGPAHGQVIDRGASVTGPGGRTVERQVRRERRPGELSREITIQRPAGTIHRELDLQRGGTMPPRGGVPASFGAIGGPRPNVYIERNVFVEPPVPRFGVSPFFSFFFGAPPLPIPPPVVFMPAPPPPPVVVVERQPYAVPVPAATAPPAQVPAFDPYSDALGRLNSRHDNSRRDGALTLGRIGDPRAVPALIDLLQSDRDPDVRTASAQALGAIGDPRAAPALETAALQDRRREVRQAASQSYARLPRAVAAPPNSSDPDAPVPVPVPPPPTPMPPNSDPPLLMPPANP